MSSIDKEIWEDMQNYIFWCQRYKLDPLTDGHSVDPYNDSRFESFDEPPVYNEIEKGEKFQYTNDKGYLIKMNTSQENVDTKSLPDLKEKIDRYKKAVRYTDDILEKIHDPEFTREMVFLIAEEHPELIVKIRETLIAEEMFKYE